MYVWLGVDVDSQLRELKAAALAIEGEIGCESSVYTLPMHISLKMPFEVANTALPEVLGAISEIYGSTQSFIIPVQGIENGEVIVWLRMGECEPLCRLSERLNRMLESRFGIPLHEYDLDWKFHSTLYMGSDTERVSRFYNEILSHTVPGSLVADRLVIGASESGKNGTYKVIKTFLI